MNKRDAVKIKRKLVEHNAVIADVKQAALTLTGKKNRQSLHGFVAGRILEKYSSVNAVRREIGISRKVSYQIHKKTITSSPKKSGLFYWHAEVKERIVEFLKRGDSMSS